MQRIQQQVMFQVHQILLMLVQMMKQTDNGKNIRNNTHNGTKNMVEQQVLIRIRLGLNNNVQTHRNYLSVRVISILF